MAKTTRRIAILGFMLETNGFAPVAAEAEFREKLYLAGDDLLADIRSPASRGSGTVQGFVEAMDAEADWEPVPILLTGAGASGPADQAFFEAVVAEMVDRLEAAGPLDGVFISQHGAASATGEFDPDGVMFAAVRRAVGDAVPVIATLDLHANVSQRMVDETDLLVAFLTNPHVDQVERGREAAGAMLEMLGGMRTARAFVRLPILPPSVSLLTSHGPYAEAIHRGQELVDDTILNVSVCGNFSLADSPKNGMSVIVTARETDNERGQAAANRAAEELAALLWRERHRFVANLTPIETATAMAVAASRQSGRPSLLFADVADNPGGGARGNTTHILKAFHEASVTGAALAVFYDAELAAEAHALGEGAEFIARFNRAEPHPLSEPFEAPARVMALTDGVIVGRRGPVAGRTVDLGPSARLRLPTQGDEGIDVIVISIRQQCHEPRMLESFGIDIAALRVLVVKSRGHFRAAFDEVFAPEQIVEVDAPGLVTPVLERVPFRHVPRPIYPLDPQMGWQVPRLG